MTAPAAEAVSTDTELTPAQQAMLAALAFAVAAEQGVERGARALVAGRMSRTDFAYYGAQQVLQAVAKAVLAGEHFAEVEWQHRVKPKIISSTEHERHVRAFDTISRDYRKAQAAELAQALKVSEVSEVSKVSDELVMRSTRVARSEVVKAGRTGYAAAVAQAVAGDPEFIWRFTTDANPCGRCLVLAERTFESFEDAPADGAHPNCACILQAEYREEPK